MYTEREVEQYDAYLEYARRSIWSETLLHKMGVPLEKIELPIIEKGKEWLFHWRYMMERGQTPLKGSMKLLSFKDYIDFTTRKK